jgi:uncharacterized protein (TIGR02246 family)
MMKRSYVAVLVPATLGALLGYELAASGGGKPASGLAPALIAAETGGRPENQDSAPSARASRSADGQAIRQAVADYAKAYKKGDVDALLAFWDVNAEFVGEDGEIIKGRQAIGNLLRKNQSALKNSRMEIHLKSARLITPDVATADANVVVRSSDGTTDTGPFTAVLTKKDGRWLFSSVRDLPEPSDTAAASPYQRLKQLEWMIGEWDDTNLEADVHLTCRWAEDKSFLLQKYTVKQKEKSFSLAQWIGWDPVRGQIRSWFFDSQGGFGEGTWTRDGNQWAVEIAGVVPDGETGTSRNLWRFVDDNNFVWQAKDREVNGRPLADVDVKFARHVEKQ